MAFLHVIIPVYNAEAYLGQAVKSVLDQPFQDISVVLVDDGATDGSPALCDEIAAREPRVCALHKPNGGVSSARNAGIEYVMEHTGANDAGYIAFLDADDFWCPAVFTDAVMETIEADHADIVGFSTYLCDQRATRLGISEQYQNATQNLAEAGRTDLHLRGPFGAHLYRLGLLRDHCLRFPEGVRRNEDVIFVKKVLFCTTKLAFNEQFLYVYRMNTDSVTHTTRYTPDNAAEIPDAWFAAAEWLDGRSDEPEQAKERWRTLCLKTAATVMLEMAGVLAECGYGHKDVEAFVRSRPYSRYIADLKVDELADWQKPDLIVFRENFRKFCRQHRTRGRTRKAMRSALRIGFVKEMYHKRKFPLSAV